MAAAAPNLILGTLSFAVCFAAWGLISAFAPAFRADLHLSARQTALLVAVPVLLGALARIPMGILTDRFGGRRVFPCLLLAVAAAALSVPFASGYVPLLCCALFLGLAGSSFAVGAGFVSPWFPPERQGAALGLYGLGNVGQSLALSAGPLIAANLGRDAVFFFAAALCLIWAAIFFRFARNAPPRKRARAGRIAQDPLARTLAAFYFLTFGGYVAFAIYLPTLLRDEFHLDIAEAGLRTAGFVVLATCARPLGGILADRVGGARVLHAVFPGIIPCALLMSWREVVPFTLGALACAMLLGFGSGAVFRLVPQFFPHSVATVSGVVGAMGGLGGFFPPLVLGFVRDLWGTSWPGFALLACTAAVMWTINRRTFLRQSEAVRAAAA